jgi:hypothetical protein
LEGYLRGRFARSFCQVVLGGSGDNLLDLLYNSNKPSNAIRPRGLGGTPIKKNHPKRRKLRFYPPCISYPRPLVQSLVSVPTLLLVYSFYPGTSWVELGSRAPTSNKF